MRPLTPPGDRVEPPVASPAGHRAEPPASEVPGVEPRDEQSPTADSRREQAAEQAGPSPETSEQPRPARPAAKTGGPGPSKLRYRLARAWAKPMLRNAVTVYLPLALLGVLGWRLAADDEVRLAAESGLAQVMERLAARPEFAVRGLDVVGASPALERAVAARVALEPGTSSLRLDLEAIRAEVETLGAVRSARVRLDPQGLLRIRITERVAEVLWRDPEDRLRLIDGEGVAIGRVEDRGDRPDLVLILGKGAPERVEEALRLIDAAPSLLPRLRALVRVGGRRWDVVLSDDLILMLPEQGAVEALAQIVLLDNTQDLLERDLAAVDMRLAGRPTLRMTPRAAEIRRLHQVTQGERGQDT